MLWQYSANRMRNLIIGPNDRSSASMFNVMRLYSGQSGISF